MTKSTLTYFSLLGVGENATPEELASRHDDIAAFFASGEVPPHLKDWAEFQSALIDEAYALLLDSDRRTATGPGVAEPEPQPASTPVPKPHRAPARTASRRWARNPLFLGAMAGLAIVAVVLIGMNGGEREDNAPASSGEEAAVPPIDMKRVTELIAVAQQDPDNLEVLFELGESFFVAGQWQRAIDWFTKVIALDPKNVHARTDIGTSHFNLGKPLEAKAAWTAALEIAPDDVQLHYNMGFLYANTEPLDFASAKREWQKVVELAPESNLAKTAQVHLGGLASVP